MKNFWQELPRPFFAQAPLANVTDAAFRRVIAKYGKPDVMYTEFVSADGLMLANAEGRAKLLRDLVFGEQEHPIVAQFFTARPEIIERATALAAALGFDGVDINMGCPDKTIEKQGAGAKLMLNPKLAQELIHAAKRGAPNLPVSIKTRLGYNKDILDDWLPALLEAQPAAVLIHARTRREMSKVPAHWERVARAVEIRNELDSDTLIIGNGDLKDIADAKEKIKQTGVDGAMLGRALFGTPWLFAEGKDPERSRRVDARFAKKSSSGDLPTGRQGLNGLLTPPEEPFASLEKRLRIAVEHTKLFEELLGDVKSFAIMKKHFKAYAEGFPGAKELRMELMETHNATEVNEIIEKFLAAQ
ncbi:MAG: tRNA-dihydrouridine synthase [bacterium]|nr:tRNA-dihydrouridine synthase [bacterium]